MQKRQFDLRDTLVRVQRFLDGNATAFAVVNSTGARKELDQSAASLTEHSVAQGEHTIGSTGETQKQRGLRAALRNRCLRPIAEVAAARLEEVPEFSALRLPSKDLRGWNLASAAYAMANAAEPYASTFTAAGLTPDFLEQLRALTRELEASLGERARHLNSRRASTIAIGAEVSRGRAALQMLDAAIQHHLPDDAQRLAEWDDVRRIRE